MREVKPTISKLKHRVYVNGAPQFELMPKEEMKLFIGTLELAIRDYYKAQDKQEENPP